MPHTAFLQKQKKHPLLLGTALLTATGLASRVIGFFYRIFLSHTIGAEGLGIYHLIFPVFALSSAFCCAGIQTAISKFTAEASKQIEKRQIYLYAGLALSTFCSLACAACIYCFSEPISTWLLNEPRCTELLRILAFSLPAAAIHSCINGYYYGLQKTAVPSMSQLLEQVARCACVYMFYQICSRNGYPITPALAVYGIVCGELAGALFSLTVLKFEKRQMPFSPAFIQIAKFSVPLTANRVLINLANSSEAVLIPICLKNYGYTNTDALRLFGILTGMAMPMILFPSVLTNSVSVMLLPSISQAKAEKKQALIYRTIRRTVESCLILGLSSTLFFLLAYQYIGTYLFANALAGQYVRTLGFICPFLFLTTTLSSIIHGLDHPTTTLTLNLFGCLVRICSIWFFIPIYGIRAYLWGILASHVLVSALALLFISRYARIRHETND